MTDRVVDESGSPVSDRPVVFVVSDAIGETAEAVARAALSQFNSGHVQWKRVPHVKDAAAVLDVIEEARGKKSAIVYTIIVPEIRAVMQREAERHGIPHVDIMGPVLDALSLITTTKPRLEPGLVHRMDEEYFRRIEALEFAVKNDDGKDPRSLVRADVVLIGVSRTSKTPVSLYLAQRCYKVANVPLVPEIPVPRELFETDPSRVVGLTVDADHLERIRYERLLAMGLDPRSGYADRRRIETELAYANGIFQKIGCPVIDVTNKAIEETATRVIQILGAIRRR